MDVVVSVPMSVAIQSAFLSRGFEPISRTWSTVLVCVIVTFAWLVGFRAGAPVLGLPPVAAWAAVAGTLWWPLTRHRASTLTVRAELQLARSPDWGHSPLR
jgi:hypothetical protein